MNTTLRNLIYAISVFVIYLVLILILNKISNKMPVEGSFLGVYSQKDLLMGLGISVFLTMMHIRKRSR